MSTPWNPYFGEKLAHLHYKTLGTWQENLEANRELVINEQRQKLQQAGIQDPEQYLVKNFTAESGINSFVNAVLIPFRAVNGQLDIEKDVFRGLFFMGSILLGMKLLRQ